MATLLTGKPVVDRLAQELAPRIEALGRAGIAPTLAIIRMGERPDDLSYERTAKKRAESLGIAVRPFVLPEDAPQEALEAALAEVSADDSIHGCLLFRPLPAHIDEARACELLAPRKDVDGITLASLASVFTDGGTGFPPSTAAACLELLDHYEVPLEGKRVAVAGRSLVVGKPVSMMLLRRNATVTLCHSGQTVLDVGINFDAEGNLCGDVDFDQAEPIVDALTPVPRGLGTVTTSVTMAHTVTAAEAALAARAGGR